MQQWKLGRKAITVTVIVGGMLGGSVALAAWGATGSGNGYATATTAGALTTIDASGATTAQLYPGATGDVVVTIHNLNPYPVRLTVIEGSGAITSDQGAACDASTGVTFTDQTGTWNVAAGGNQQVTLTGAVSMDNTSDTTYQGALFTIPVNGSATASVSIPSGTSDGVHAVYAVGSGGSVASATVTIDRTAPVVAAAAIQKSAGGRGWKIKLGGAYYVYADFPTPPRA